MSDTSVRDGLNHILLIYRRSIVEFLGREKFINTLLDIITYLYNISVKNISIFEPSGLVYRIIRDNLRHRLSKSGFFIHSSGDNSLTFSRHVEEINNGSEAVDKSQSFTSSINYFHASSAHLELLAFCNRINKIKKRVKKKIEKKARGKTFRIPPQKAIIQPRIAKRLSISTPQIIICVNLSLGQILFTFNIPFIQRLNNLKSLIADITAPSKRYIYPFGPSGVPPWALSEAEIYQVFGTETNVIEHCITLFKKSSRRHGK